MDSNDVPSIRPQAGGLRIQSPLDRETELLVSSIISAAIEVHRDLGPGHPESFYEEALCLELTWREIPFIRQHATEVQYKGHRVGQGRVDLIVADLVIVELKAIELLTKLHEAQLAAYLKATKLRIGLLINFNVELLKKGIKRIIN